MPTRYSTVLGSCVAVCLYDVQAGVGGLNHFLLPGTPGPEEQEPLRWSGPAMAALLAGLLEAGAHRRRLQAKVFGGAQIGVRSVPEKLRVGARNVDAALAELERLRIPVMNQSLGGGAGRKIIFESHTGMVWEKLLDGRATLRG
jgi:chemotaxis protein CheD